MQKKIKSLSLAEAVKGKGVLVFGGCAEIELSRRTWIKGFTRERLYFENQSYQGREEALRTHRDNFSNF